MIRPSPTGRHRRPVSHVRRRAPYAAAGLLALTGTVTPALLRAETRPAAAVSRPALARRASPRTLADVVRRAPVRAGRGSPRTAPPRAEGPTLRGRATWYGPGFDGRRTASGERFAADRALTAAHRTLPFGTLLRVCHGRRCVVVRINDRGPFGNAILDLSHLAAVRLGIERRGVAYVTATVLHAE
ncbi:MAG: rare lipoprotein [Frankiaceae bacterium]|jgi:rare lipoprotein A|nr:rare lipoprotein [Frankiaceae bacterium]